MSRADRRGYRCQSRVAACVSTIGSAHETLDIDGSRGRTQAQTLSFWLAVGRFVNQNVNYPRAPTPQLCPPVRRNIVTGDTHPRSVTAPSSGEQSRSFKPFFFSDRRLSAERTVCASRATRHDGRPAYLESQASCQPAERIITASGGIWDILVDSRAPWSVDCDPSAVGE